MAHLKFDIAKLEKLNDPGRFDTLKPDVMWDALDCSSPGVVVEIGAGTGMFAERFAEFAPAAVVYAVDLEQTMIDWMRDNRPLVADGRIVPVLAEETRVPLDGGIADAVFMINLHHELAEPDQTYAEAFRLLKPGGRLLAVDWAPTDTPRGPSQAVRVSVKQAERVARGAGFSEIESHDGLPWHWMVTGSRR